MATRPVVTIRVPSPVELPPGGSAEARIGLTVANGYHVQANPTNQQFLIPLELEVAAVNGIRPGAPVYPLGRPFRLEGAGDDLPTYGGTFEVVLPLEAEASAAVGERVLRAALRYQGCDKRSCLFPAVERFTLHARVIGPTSAATGC